MLKSCHAMVKLAENEGGANIRPQLSRNKTHTARKRPFFKEVSSPTCLSDDASRTHINGVNKN